MKHRARGSVDFHNHLIPGVDDGARDMEQALEGVGRLAEAGVQEIVTTPHVSVLALKRPGEEEWRRALDEGWRALQEACHKHFPQVSLYSGAEILLDWPEIDLSNPRLRLAGGRFALVEFPLTSILLNTGRMLETIRAGGVQPIVAHPERYVNLTEMVEEVVGWHDAGILLQVNAGSLAGYYGEAIQARAMWLLEGGFVDYGASDFHGRRGPWLAEAWAALASVGGDEQAELLFDVNPRRILTDEPPLPVPPLPKDRRERRAGARRRRVPWR